MFSEQNFQQTEGHGNDLVVLRSEKSFTKLEKRTILPKIQEPDKSNEMEIPDEIFLTIWGTSRGCPLFRKFGKLPFYLPLEIS